MSKRKTSNHHIVGKSRYFTPDGEEIKDNKYAVGCAIGCFIYVVIMSIILMIIIAKYLLKLLML